MLNYQCYGEGHATLVLVHGLLGSSDNWRALAKQWARHYRVICVDCRNHGNSFHHAESSYITMAHDILEVIHHEQAEPCVLLGHSMGGKIALQCLHIKPAAFTHGIIIDIAPKTYPFHHQSLLDTLCHLDLSAHSHLKTLDEALSATVANKAIRQFALKNIARNAEGEFYWKANIHFIRDNYPHIMAWEPLNTPIQTPCLFLAGEFSDYISHTDHNLIRSVCPNSTISPIAKAGHWVQAEQPQAVSDTIMQWLNA